MVSWLCQSIIKSICKNCVFTTMFHKHFNYKTVHDLYIYDLYSPNTFLYFYTVLICCKLINCTLSYLLLYQMYSIIFIIVF